MNFSKLITIICIVFFTATNCKPDYGNDVFESDANQPVNVQTTTLIPVKDPIPVTASGKISKKSTVHLSFKTGGFVQALNKSEGEEFSKGNTLASLDLSEIDARFEKARQAFEKSERDLERGRRLLNDSAATSEQVQDLETAYEIAKADYRIAGYNKKHSVITAPSDGKILRRLSEEGEQIEPGQPVYRVGMGRFIVELGVSDRDVVNMAMGDSAKVHMDAFPGNELSARVTEIAEESDPATGTFSVEVTIEEGDEFLKSGLIAGATLFPSKVDPYYRLPMNALVEANGEFATVFIAENRKARLLSVPYGTILKDAFTVPAREISRAELEIITHGSNQLRDGRSIDILTESEIAGRTNQ
ncbi:MAG: efflux RND transporter periplasmic adaptor subunit [Bacteroidetes bacterium]|jgi:RND family efflux transporter MFP subunit|nr:efflux RND transporter periplasmic adaptor subunit [Bacteroidota bacterium]